MFFNLGRKIEVGNKCGCFFLFSVFEFFLIVFKFGNYVFIYLMLGIEYIYVNCFLFCFEDLFFLVVVEEDM